LGLLAANQRTGPWL